jgi:hypothetical protein
MRNNGDLTFTDISAESGFEIQSGSINTLDLDNNGWTDIIYGDWTANMLTLQLNTGGIFTTTMIQLPVDLYHGFTLFDLDEDGHTDILSSIMIGNQAHLIVGYNDVCTVGPGNSFQNWTIIAGPFPIQPGAVILPSLMDYDNDGDLDMIVVHETNASSPGPGYHYQTLKLFRNDNGIFTDVTVVSGLTLGHRNGPTQWDYNNDGYMDLLFGDGDCCDQPRMNRVYRNNGNGTFTDLGGSLGLRSGNTYYFPPSIFDVENDGDEDVLWDIWSSFNLQQIYINYNGTFGTNQSPSFGLNITNENPIAFDADNDGDIDLICGSHGEFPVTCKFMVNPLLPNSESGANYLKIVMKGCASGRSAVNTLVRVYWQETTLAKRTQGLENGYDQAPPDHLHFGLGTATHVDSIVVHWPSGAITRQYVVPTNQQLVIQESVGCGFTACLPITAPIDCEGIAGGSALTGTPCNDGLEGTINDTWTNDCQCLGTPINCTENITLNITVDAFGGQTTWTIFEEGTTNVVADGGPYQDGIDSAIITEELCLPPGCYHLALNDAAGDGINGGGMC